MVCPELSANNFDILGEPSSMVASKLIFQIRKCNNDTQKLNNEPECEDPDKIDEFIEEKGIMVESWVVHQKIDFYEKFN